jgi:ABC-type proline/glycine betaine transport system substrate-binding protein
MHKVTMAVAVATLALFGAPASSRADDSGHVSINSLNWQLRQQHRSIGRWRRLEAEGM